MLDKLPLSGWFLIFILMLIAYRYMTGSRVTLPPGPPSFPIIGSLPFMAGDMRKVYAKLAAKYGNVFMISIGSQKAVILQGYETIKQAFVKTPNVFDGRSDMFVDIAPDRGISCTQGEIWKVQRRFAFQTLKDFGLGRRPMEILVKDEANYLVNELETICGTPFNAENILQKATANVVKTVLFGRRQDYEDPQFAQFLRVNGEAIRLLGPNNPAVIFKFLRSIPGDPFQYHKGVGMVQDLMDIFRKEIDIRKQQSECEDFTTLYLKKIPDWKDLGDSAFFEQHLLHSLADLFGGGTNSTSHTILWALLYLILNPDIQDKVRQEIDDVTGRDAPPSMIHRADMPYTEAVISETQRICFIFPVALPHATMEDTVLNGYTIPKGTMVIPNMYSVLWDPVVWPQPEKFDPKRFLDDEGKYRKREEFIPFSIGKRACPGESLAKMELFLILTRLLQAFTFSVPPNQPKPTTEGVLGFSYHPQDFDLFIESRK